MKQIFYHQATVCKIGIIIQGRRYINYICESKIKREPKIYMKFTQRGVEKRRVHKANDAKWKLGQPIREKVTAHFPIVKETNEKVKSKRDIKKLNQ